MPTIIGVDPSMTATGVAIVRWQPRKAVTAYCYTVRTPSTMDAPGRWRLIITRLWPEVDIGRTFMGVETLPVGKQPVSGMFVERAGLIALIRYGCDARGVPVALINPKTLKKYATGDGGASKDAMKRAARTALNVAPRNDNEADALWCAAMVAARYAVPWATGPVTKAQKEAVDVPTWPHWTPL